MPGKAGTKAPDMSDVLTMWAMVEHDLSLWVTLQVRPGEGGGKSAGYSVTLRCEPKGVTGNPWLRWHPLDITSYWHPDYGKDFPTFLWFLLFGMYSTDLPEDWPKLDQLPLPGLNPPTRD